MIGLEVHAQLSTASKLFSSASALDLFTARPNSRVAAFDLSLPGTLPVLNRSAVIAAIRTALTLDCTVARRSSFDRKHYFYGDMPNGYQITQQRAPIARDGLLEFIVYDEYNDHLLFGGSSNPTAAQLKSRQHLLPYLKRCQLKQLQLEQDSGKSLADDDEEDGEEGEEGETAALKSSSTRKQRLIDLNRAGVPLLEFVFEPQLSSSLEAASLVRELILRLQAIEVCSCRLAEGALRVDANVSIRPRGGSPTLGTRTEIKNLNSLRFLREAIDYEIERQAELIRAGGAVVNETLGFDFRSRRTYPMRDKEIVQDYRFMPEPNLPPVLLRNSAEDRDQGDKDLLDIAAIADELTSSFSSSSNSLSPQQVRAQLQRPEYDLSLREVFFLTNDAELRRLFLGVFEIVSSSSSSKSISGRQIFAFLHQLTTPPATFVDPERHWQYSVEVAELGRAISTGHLAELVGLLFGGRISEPTAYQILKSGYLQQKEESPPAMSSPSEIAHHHGWWLVVDEAEIEAVCREVAASLPKIAAKFARSGVRRPRSMLVQRATEALQGRVNEAQLWPVFERILRAGGGGGGGEGGGGDKKKKKK